MFDPNTLHNNIVFSMIHDAIFKFKPVMFQMLYEIGQLSRAAATEDPYLHIKQFNKVASNLKIVSVDEDNFNLSLFPFICMHIIVFEEKSKWFDVDINYPILDNV